MKLRLSIVLLAVALVVLGAAFVFATGRQRGEARMVTAVLPRVDGLREGALVTYLGLEIGYVDRLRIHEGRVIADLRIHRADADLRRNDTIRLRTLGISSDKVLDVSPGVRSAPQLGPSDTLVGITPTG